MRAAAGAVDLRLGRRTRVGARLRRADAKTVGVDFGAILSSSSSALVSIESTQPRPSSSGTSRMSESACTLTYDARNCAADSVMLPVVCNAIRPTPMLVVSDRRRRRRRRRRRTIMSSCELLAEMNVGAMKVRRTTTLLVSAPGHGTPANSGSRMSASVVLVRCAYRRRATSRT